MLKKIIFCLLILFLIATIIFVWGYYTCQKAYDYPTFTTKYSINEHIERIKQKTEERFARELADGSIVNYRVDIVHSFYDNDPEYFVIEVEYAEEFDGKFYNPEYYFPTNEPIPMYIQYKTKYKHTLGYIHQEKYYIGTLYEKFEDGQSPYAKTGNWELKKYYGQNVMAVQKDQDIIKIFESNCKHCDGYFSPPSLKDLLMNICNECYGELIPEEKWKSLMGELSPRIGCPAY